jgi:hypothetical protein
MTQNALVDHPRFSLPPLPTSTLSLICPPPPEIMYALMKNSTLTSLNLSDNQIGVKEVSHLTDLRGGGNQFDV